METGPRALIGKTIKDRVGVAWEIRDVRPFADLQGRGNVWNSAEEEVTAVTVARDGRDPVVLQVPVPLATLVLLEWEAQDVITRAFPDDVA